MLADEEFDEELVQIRWKTVFYSFVIQFILAAIVIRLEVGFQFFEFLGNEVSAFIQFVREKRFSSTRDFLRSSETPKPAPFSSLERRTKIISSLSK